jgi:hypothetical protein
MVRSIGQNNVRLSAEKREAKWKKGRRRIEEK